MTFHPQAFPEHLYFVTGSLIGWLPLLARPEFAALLLDSLAWHRQHVMKRSGRMLLAIASIVMIGSCTDEIAVTTAAKHTIGKSIEGTYDVYFNQEIIGQLDLKNSQYSFVSQQDAKQLPQGAIVNRFFFVKHPEGRYSIEYFDAINQDVLLEDLGEYAILLYIRFDFNQTDEQDGISGSTSPLEDVFVICKKGKVLFFQRVANELQIWNVMKPWN